MTPEQALRRDHPQQHVDDAAARTWLAARRAVLQERVRDSTRAGSAVSSGCAASGAAEHARVLAEEARDALARWERGEGTRCERCDAVIPFERLEAAVAATRCTGCARPSSLDTRWCR